MGTCENTCAFRGHVILEKVNIVDLIIILFFITSVMFEDPTGRLTWYFFFFYMSV